MVLAPKPKAKTTQASSKTPKLCLTGRKAKTAASKPPTIMEMLGKKTLNSSQIEFICYSKLRTLLHLFKEGIPIPKTVFVPCDATDTMKNGQEIHNEKDIADLFEQKFPSEGIVIKADAGTHGKMIMLSQNREELEANIKETKPSIINPIGVVAQELVQKWFYDLRIIVPKKKANNPFATTPRWHEQASKISAPTLSLATWFSTPNCR